MRCEAKIELSANALRAAAEDKQPIKISLLMRGVPLVGRIPINIEIVPK